MELFFWIFGRPLKLYFYMESKEEFYQIQGDAPYTYYFIYKNKKYPIIFDLFKGYSNYFQSNEAEIEHSRIIPLINKEEDQFLEIDDKTIDTFIKFVHRERVGISNENVTILNYLAQKYEIEPLIEVTNEFIKKHRREVVIDYLLINQKNTIIDTSTYENILSNHLLEYMHDDRLLLLKFPVLYRILAKYEEMRPKTEQKNDEYEAVVEFYMKCLDKFGREASILFKNVDFQYLKNDYVNLLTTKYSTIFDFHFINSSCMKNIYEEQNSIYLQIDEMKKYFIKEFETIKKENKKHEETEEQLRQEIISLKAQIKIIEESNSYEKTINRATFESLFPGFQTSTL